MNIIVNDLKNNLITELKGEAVPHVGEEILLGSLNRSYAVTDVVHVFNEDNEGGGYIIQVVELGVGEYVPKDLPEWLARAY